MRPIRTGTRAAAAVIAPEDGFDGLRDAFCIRLKTERILLVTLGAALERGAPNRTQIMNELSSRAHRISGAAALFEHAGIAKSARVLELAVVSASMLLASDADRAIAAALDDLMRLIESLDTESFNAQG